MENGFFNNGLYEMYEDWGCCCVMGLFEDDGVFCVFILCNIVFIVFYMYDGSLFDL